MIDRRAILTGLSNDARAKLRALRSGTPPTADAVRGIVGDVPDAHVAVLIAAVSAKAA